MCSSYDLFFYATAIYSLVSYRYSRSSGMEFIERVARDSPDAVTARKAVDVQTLTWEFSLSILMSPFRNECQSLNYASKCLLSKLLPQAFDVFFVKK